MVKARHQLHIAIGIHHSHECLVTHLQISMVIALTVSVNIRVIGCELIFQRDTGVTAFTRVVALHGATVNSSRRDMTCHVFAVLGISELQVIRIKARLVLIVLLHLILHLWLTGVTRDSSPMDTHLLVNVKVRLHIPQVYVVYISVIVGINICRNACRLHLIRMEYHVIDITTCGIRSLADRLTIIVFIVSLSLVVSQESAVLQNEEAHRRT